MRKEDLIELLGKDGEKMVDILNKGEKAFRKVLRGKYVDKSEIINVINSKIDSSMDMYMCVTRARRFGKSVTLSMLNAYYSKGASSKELFDNLKISKCDSYLTHLNKHNVFQIDMGRILSSVRDNVYNYTMALNQNIILNLEEYFSIDLSSFSKASEALRYTHKMTGETFIFLIDEWDELYRTYPDDSKLCNDYSDFLKDMFKSLDYEYIELVFMTGILPPRRYNNQSFLNNFIEYNPVSPDELAPYFGFTEDEVQHLCDEYGMDLNKLKEMYNGYNFDDVITYNPLSVCRAITSKKIRPYWTGTAGVGEVINALNFYQGELEPIMERLFNDEHVPVDVLQFSNKNTEFKSKDDSLTLLIHYGYLAYDIENECCYIPNFEIYRNLVSIVEELKWTNLSNPLKMSLANVKALYSNKINVIEENLAKLTLEHASIMNKSSEAVIQTIISFAFQTLVTSHYKVFEAPVLNGRADIGYLPKFGGKAIIIEVKVDKNTSVALDQIHNKNYGKLGQYKGECIFIGINYDNETNKYSVMIENVVIE